MKSKISQLLFFTLTNFTGFEFFILVDRTLVVNLAETDFFVAKTEIKQFFFFRT